MEKGKVKVIAETLQETGRAYEYVCTEKNGQVLYGV